MSTPSRIRISPRNGERIAKIATSYSSAGLNRSWNAIGHSALTAGLDSEEERARNITKAAGKKTK